MTSLCWKKTLFKNYQEMTYFNPLTIDLEQKLVNSLAKKSIE